LAPTLFDAGKNRFVVGDPVAGKQAGQAATGNETVGGEKLNLSAQPEICDICCRDHHDYTGVNAYDPFRPSGDHAGDGDHNHYFPDSSGVLQLANHNNDLYVEACRMVRVDGIWRVTPDWRLEGLQVLPSEFLQTNTDDFRSYVRQFVKEYISRVSTVSYPQITPNPADFTSLDYATALEALPNSEDGDELSLSTISASQRKKQLHAFGLYIDYMGDTLINELQTRITSGDESFMESVPFHLVNVTRLANWSASSDAVSVSDQPIADGSEATYSRGLIAAVNPGNAMVTATLERSNTGFTDTRAVDGDDEAFGSDALNVVVDDGTDTTPGIIVSGTIGISGNIDTRPSDIRVTGGNGAFCTKPTDETYACTLDPAVAGNTITFSNYNYLVVDKKCNSAMVFDNKVSPETGSVVVDNKQHAETTSFTFTDVTDSLEMNIEVKKDFGKQACPSP
jgi:hypothetical protein